MNKDNMAQTQTLKLVYRRTDMGGLSLPLVLKVNGQEVKTVEPVGREHSCASHGVWIYRIDDIDVAFVLRKSLGRRSVLIAYARCRPDVDNVIKFVVNRWFEGYTYEEILRILLGIWL